MLATTVTTILPLLLLLLPWDSLGDSLARCHQADLSYQILSGFVFTHTPSIISTQVSRAISPPPSFSREYFYLTQLFYCEVTQADKVTGRHRYLGGDKLEIFD